MTTDHDLTHVDGNAVIGALSLALGVDAATVSVACAGCDDLHDVAETRVYLRCPGIVIRCPRCNAAEIVLVEIDHRMTLTVTGAARIDFAARA